MGERIEYGDMFGQEIDTCTDREIQISVDVTIAQKKNLTCLKGYAFYLTVYLYDTKYARVSLV